MNHEVIVGIRENSDLEEPPSAVGTDLHREIRLVRCRDGNDRIGVGMADVLVGDPVFPSTREHLHGDNCSCRIDSCATLGSRPVPNASQVRNHHALRSTEARAKPSHEGAERARGRAEGAQYRPSMVMKGHQRRVEKDGETANVRQATTRPSATALAMVGIPTHRVHQTR